MSLYILLTSPTFQLSVFMSISLISSSTDLGLIVFHLVLILYLNSNAYIVSFMFCARYSLLRTSLDIFAMNFLFFTFFYNYTSFHSHSPCLIVTCIGTWSEMFLFSAYLISISFSSIWWVIIISMLLFLYLPNPFLVQDSDSWQFHPYVLIYSLNSLYFFSSISELRSMYNTFWLLYYCSTFVIYENKSSHFYLEFWFGQWYVAITMFFYSSPLTIFMTCRAYFSLLNIPLPFYVSIFFLVSIIVPAPVC